MYLVVSAQALFPGSADTQVFVITGGQQDTILSFSGFLNSTSDDINNFRGDEVIIYSGANVPYIIATNNERSKENAVTETHSFRRFDLTPETIKIMFDWLFAAGDFQELN